MAKNNPILHKENLLQKTIERLAAEGYAPVSRIMNQKHAKNAPYFLLGEYWRLDNPRIQALICLDLSNDQELVVTFQQRETSSSPLCRMLGKLFHRAATRPFTIKAETFCHHPAPLPFAARDHDGAAIYRHLAHRLLTDITPAFFISPKDSNDQFLTLRAYKQGCRKDKRQIASTAIITLYLPVSDPASHDAKISLQAQKEMADSFPSPLQTVSIDNFIKNHAGILEAHIQKSLHVEADEPLPKAKP